MPRNFFKTVFWNVVIAVAYFLTGLWGLDLAFINSNVTLIWPPTGIAIAGLFFLRLNAAPGILAGALIANLLNGADPVIATCIAAGNTVGMVIGYGLARSAFRGAPDFAQVRFTVSFIVYAAILGTIFTSLWGVSTLYLANIIQGGAVLETGLVWWIGDAMGVLIFGAPLISIAKIRKNLITWPGILEFAFLLAFASTICYSVFFADLGIASHYPLIYLVFPFLVWAAIRFGPGGGSILVLLVAVFSINSTAAGLGPFAREEIHNSLLFLHTYLSLFAITTLFLGSILEEKRQYVLEISDARERADESNRLKSEFLANMSHEIRTPVSVILGFIDLLKDPELTEVDRNHHIDTIRRNGHHLLALINDILDLSRIEAGRLPVEKQKVALVAFLEELSEPFRLHARDKGLGFSLSNEGNVPRYIISDPMRLRQILSNLLGNAVKFTERGTVGLHLTASPEGSGTNLQFTVTDTGPGMDSVQIKNLFKPFSQVDTSPQRRFGGAGLGLAISRRLAELMKGQLEVESAPDVGSSFSFKLQLLREECIWHDDLDTKEKDSSGFPRGQGRIVLGNSTNRKPEILVVEDTEDIQILIRRQLESLGASVFEAYNGKEALDIVDARRAPGKGGRFDVILMDIQMPVMDGYETVRRLRATGYSGRIIALTAHAMEGEEKKCLAAGMDAYLSKPVERTRLKQAIGLNGGRGY